ncbi:sel1 repeat family protein [Rhizobium laguerreae]|uniref:tetratricopeptide repeat protein n=1 Tax=Rhizobium laguerreae TaxID=1076926 RepID=UPI001C919B9F|nr:hypothetical protein [Rhizobium laguerreae]MBY3151313.1 sel1 repeat family protein [Rhizobium laguerreae]
MATTAAELKGILAGVDDLILKGDFDAAADRMHDLMDGPKLQHPKETVPRLEKLVEHSALAAFDLASYFTARIGGDEQALELYRIAADSDDHSIAGPANLAIGMLLFGKGRDSKGANEYMRKAAEMGQPHALFAWGVVLFEGRPSGPEADPDAAMKFLEEAIDEHDSSDAQLYVAQMIIKRRIKSAKYDPMTLLSQSVAGGNEEAMRVLEDIGAFTTEDDEDDDQRHEAMLAYVVKPDGAARPKSVRLALERELKLDPVVAGTVTAALYGFPSWKRLLDATAEKRTPIGIFDEQLTAEQINERLKSQASVLLYHVKMPSYLADIAVELLKPTSKSTVPPSLTKMRERARDRIFKIGSNDRQLSTSLLEERGIETDTENAMRFAKPLVPDVWLGAMEQHLGWSLAEHDYDAKREAAKVAVAPSSVGKIDVYMSRVSFRPGDVGDTYVEKLMAQLGEKSEKAILLFNIPIVYPRETGVDFGVFYGGKINTSGVWYDFVMRPGGGVEDAIAQRLLIEEKAVPGFVETYGFEGAPSLGATLAAMRASGSPQGKMVPITPRGHGWALFVPVELALEMRKQFDRR